MAAWFGVIPSQFHVIFVKRLWTEEENDPCFEMLIPYWFRLRSVPKAGKQTVSMNDTWIALQRTLKVWFKTEWPENCACVPPQRVLWEKRRVEDVLINRFTVSLLRKVELDVLCFIYLHRYLDKPSDGDIYHINQVTEHQKAFILPQMREVGVELDQFGYVLVLCSPPDSARLIACMWRQSGRPGFLLGERRFK